MIGLGIVVLDRDASNLPYTKRALAAHLRGCLQFELPINMIISQNENLHRWTWNLPH